ncbi:MAG: prolipoprotein diacylglyceryl transferase [Clostridiales bacterium]|nr:prolipoprotein diacylglyceryl transferase [Clostridiales bacterium]
MFPFIRIPSDAVGDISTFQLCAIAGILAFVLSTIFLLRKKPNFGNEVYFIVPKLFIALGLGFGGAILFDAVAHYAESGVFRYTGISYYGGVLVGLPTLAILIYAFRRNSSKSVIEWLNFLTVPYISFHCIARFGCFLGGCCYGVETDGPFGLMFPDVPESGIYHYGHKVIPTNLIEALSLLVLGVILFFYVKKHKFVTFVFAYAIMRFIIEFWRGDDRGAYVGALSPSQFVSVLIVAVGIVWLLVLYFIDLKKLTRRVRTAINSDGKERSDVKDEG